MSKEQQASPVLLSCPFCGGAARFEFANFWHNVVVAHKNDCVLDGDTAEMTYADSLGVRERMAAKWNERADAASPVVPPAPGQAQPADCVLMPRALTASNGAKAALMGEFHEEISVTCPECDGGNDRDHCHECNDEGTVSQRVAVEWDTIKRIYGRAVELLAQPVGQACSTQVASAEQNQIGAKMRCGTVVTNVYEAFEAGARASSGEAIANWLRRNANAESDPAKRAVLIEAHNAARELLATGAEVAQQQAHSKFGSPELQSRILAHATENLHVMPPTRGTGSQHEAGLAGLARLTSDQIGEMLHATNAGYDDPTCSHFPYDFARHVEVAVRDQIAASRGRAQGGNTPETNKHGMTNAECLVEAQFIDEFAATQQPGTQEPK